MIAVFELKKSKRNHAKIHQEFKKEQSKTSIAAAKKNSIYKWAASFYLMNISMPNNDRTGGTLFWIIHQKRCHTDITCSQKPKNNSFLFLKKTTILLQWIRSIFKIVCDCVWLYTYLLTTYLKVLTYFLVSFLFFCVFSLFVFFFFCKKPNPDYFFCKKILRTFLPPPNNVMLCFSYFQKHLNQEKKVNKSKKTKHQISSQINNF